MKRLCALLLAALLAAACLPLSALAAGYSDVAPDAWYAWSVNDARQRDLLKGTGNNRFSPDGTLTRAMMVTILWRLAGQPMVKTPIPFSDVDQVQWYSYAVAWANEHRVTEGVGNNLFGPDEPVTREQMAVLFYRWARGQGYDVTFPPNPAILAEEADIQTLTLVETETGSYTRVVPAGRSVSHWAEDAVVWAAEQDFLTRRRIPGIDPQGGSVFKFCVEDPATRAEVAVFLSRFCRTYLDGADTAAVRVTPWDGSVLSLAIPERWMGGYSASIAGYEGVPNAFSMIFWDLSNQEPRSSLGMLFTLTLWPVGKGSDNFGNLERLPDAVTGQSGRLCTVQTPQGKMDLYVIYPETEFEDGFKFSYYDEDNPKNYLKMQAQIDGILRSIRFREDVKILSLAPFFSAPLETKTTLPDWPNGSPVAMDLETVK